MAGKHVTFSHYDTAVYLRNEQDIKAYLEAVLEDGDPSMIGVALGNIARSRSISQLARDAKISSDNIYDVLSGQGNPSFSTITKLANVLGFRIELIKKPVSGPAER
ncbi:putative addiction module antidote protein [Aeromonas bestiarum]|uniref:addiction module antidote protein n=1 Tax=Aeromonas bestiarum TaxID=105751 RepID=UPI0023783218|nr:addiction module antidote protein [Aeromonas bestiarum]WDL84047.1 putative addiction module antidote protein [Aeromonas bestiarum]